MPPELYSEQDVETKVVIPRLRELGYEEGDDKVSLRHQHPIKAQQGRETKTIYADLVVQVNGAPVIVVDSKNPRRYLDDNDRAQVISYARLIGEIAPYAALCNGHTWEVYDSVTKQQIPKLPAIDDLVADLQKRRLSDRARLSIRAQAERTLFAIDGAREMSRLMHRCHDVIRNLKGYDPTRAFDELSKLLFAKMYEEREVAEGRREVNRFTTEVVQEMRKQGVEIIGRLWAETIQSPQYREIFSDQEATDIDLPPAGVDEIVSILENKSLGLTDLDVKGVAFEEFLASTYRGGGLGQFFTPREVVNFMVDLVDPAIGDRVVDPSCGTGGFLIRVYDTVSEKIHGSELSDKEKRDKLEALANSSLVGIDWEARAARTCKMNMIIHGDGHAGVYQANSLDVEEVQRKVEERRRFFEKAAPIDADSFDVILTNPPFGARDKADEVLRHYELGRGRSQKREVLMLERCIKLLKPGGRMAVVIPEGILSNQTDNNIRDYIRKHCVIKAIIRLPQDAFKMSEGAANTSVLYVVKKDPADADRYQQGDVFCARAEYIGITPSGKPIDQNDLVAIREHYRQFERGDWSGVEMQAGKDGRMEITRAVPDEDGGLWLEPEVNRTSLLYDRLSYVVRDPDLTDRFSYTFFHPYYYRTVNGLRSMETETVTLGSLCVDGFPRTGKRSSEQSGSPVESLPIIKLRNVTGAGLNMDTDFAPDTEDVRKDCAKGLLEKGDILITSTGEGTIGRVDMYPFDEPAIADGEITICRVRQGVSRRYVLEFLRGEQGQVQLLRHVSGSTGQTHLMPNAVDGLLVPLPEKDLQKRIVEGMQEARDLSGQLHEKAEGFREKGAEVLAKGRRRMLDMLKGQQPDDDAPDRDKLSMYPLPPEEELSAFMEVDRDSVLEAEKREKRKKKKGK